MKNSFEYKGYYVEYNFYGHGEYTVQYCGDDIICQTEEEARKTIDDAIEWEKTQWG